ncbi:MAG: hypothetical protein KZQ95_10675 [Candidatus Thiodiazotropha sp. (ex Epidulcina cf. delphinae)]|nr:hypothetical protein [Candidatus Thiodiazotropha sp. (ex Epidulcina cf. delphinae)]
MLNLFNRHNPLLDEDIIEWIFNCYAWALDQFDRSVFFNETILVIPDNTHFPGREQSVEGMANLIFNQVKQYAGMAHWPTHLINQSDAKCQAPGSLPVEINGALRGKSALIDLSHTETTGNTLSFFYDPQQLNSPEGLIAHFAHGLSYHLASTAKAPPPGGEDYAPIAGELTGVFMGFGLMFANSATVPRGGGCGGCAGQGPVRQAFLSEEEATYALALFCVLKNIGANKAVGHLKKYLRRFFKAAVKDCEQRMKNYSHLKLTDAVNH